MRARERAGGAEAGAHGARVSQASREALGRSRPPPWPRALSRFHRSAVIVSPLAAPSPALMARPHHVSGRGARRRLITCASRPRGRAIARWASAGRTRCGVARAPDVAKARCAPPSTSGARPSTAERDHLSVDPATSPELQPRARGAAEPAPGSSLLSCHERPRPPHRRHPPPDPHEACPVVRGRIRFENTSSSQMRFFDRLV